MHIDSTEFTTSYHRQTDLQSQRNIACILFNPYKLAIRRRQVTSKSSVLGPISILKYTATDG